MTLLGLAFIFFFGATIGSFINAVAWRLHAGESFVISRSYCPECRHPLAAQDLVPIVSYLVLGGHCRYCRHGIGLQYLAVEIVMGIAFVLCAMAVFAPYSSDDQLVRLLFYWYATAMLVLIFVFDLRYMLILPTVALPAALVVFLGNWGDGGNPFLLLLGAAIGGGFFWLQYVVSKGRWIGGGDIYLGVLMGALLGVPKIFVALFIAYVVGAIVSSALLAFRKKTMKSEVPFGTFLTFAAFVAMLYGDRIISWYLGAL